MSPERGIQRGSRGDPRLFRGGPGFASATNNDTRRGDPVRPLNPYIILEGEEGMTGEPTLVPRLGLVDLEFY